MNEDEYTCERCDYKTKVLCNLKTHLTKKKQCQDILQSGKTTNQLYEALKVDKSNYNHKCEYCDAAFNSRQGKHQHIQHCKAKIINDDKDKIIEELRTQLTNNNNTSNVVSGGISNNASTSTGNITQNQNINITNNITQNIFVINNFGNENIEHILNDKDLLDKCMQELSSSSIENIVRKIYYDDNYPENHTIFGKNIRLNQVMVRENGEWVCKSYFFSFFICF